MQKKASRALAVLENVALIDKSKTWSKGGGWPAQEQNLQIIKF